MSRVEDLRGPAMKQRHHRIIGEIKALPYGVGKDLDELGARADESDTALSAQCQPKFI